MISWLKALPSFVRQHAPVVSALVSGFAVMSLELLGSRIVAPFLGASILIWTNLIGVILVSMAIGAWLGGVAADRFPDRRLIGSLLALAGFWCFLLGRFAAPAMEVLAHLPGEMAAPVAALLLLAPPAFALSAISPAVLRLSMTEVSKAGHVAGLVSALGTVGSLVGTYVTGYVLLPRFSVPTLLYALGIVLCVLALIPLKAFFRSKSGIVLGCSILFLPLTTPSLPTAVHEIPSAYGYVAYIDHAYAGQPARLLRINMGVHSVSSLADPKRSITEYVQGMRAVDMIVPTSSRVLSIGGGGFHVATEYTERHPEAQVDVVEIDPAVFVAAQEAFGATTTDRLHLFIDDARPAMARLQPGYDLVIADAFSGDTSVPWYLLTQEAMRQYHDMLKPGGLFMANMILTTKPTDVASEQFAARTIGTVRSAFRWAFAVDLANSWSSAVPANVLVFAGDGPEPDHAMLVEAIRRETGKSVSEVAFPTTGEPWTDQFGTADYQSLAMYREALKRLNAR